MQCHAQGVKRLTVRIAALVCPAALLPCWLAGWRALLACPRTAHSAIFTLSVARLGRYGDIVPPAALAVARQPSLVVRGQRAAGAHPAAAETPLCFSSLVSPDFEQRIFFVK